MSEDMTGLVGWEATAESSGGVGTAVTNSIVQTTRVGGATFVKNASTEDTQRAIELEAKDSLNMLTQDSSRLGEDDK